MTNLCADATDEDAAIAALPVKTLNKNKLNSTIMATLGTEEGKAPNSGKAEEGICVRGHWTIREPVPQ